MATDCKDMAEVAEALVEAFMKTVISGQNPVRNNNFIIAS